LSTNISKVKKSAKQEFVNREVSWLYFNHRVLQEAADPGVPLLERLRFLGIYSNNLDEFFRVRVATLTRMSEIRTVVYPTNEDPKTVLKKIAKMTASLQPKFEAVYNDIVDALAKVHIFIVNETRLNAQQKTFVDDYYHNQLADTITPLMISRMLHMPALSDSQIYLAVKLSHSNNPKKKEIALIEIPTNDFSRFLELPRSGEKRYFILLDDVIRLCLPSVFKSLSYDTFEAYTFKITRDAEMDNESELGDGLMDKVAKGVKSRRLGSPVRFVYDEGMPGEIKKVLLGRLNFKKSDNLVAGGRYHNFRDFINFPFIDLPGIAYPSLKPLTNSQLSAAPSMMGVIEQEDQFLHYPYFSFSHYVRLLREAAIDPRVRSIKITLYRVASNSKVTRALINAARNGKQVTAVVELRARFDEEHNIKWATRMQEAGIRVVFGVEELKIHSKLTLIQKKNGKGIAVLSTGNFHEGNASVYTDFALFTAHPKIFAEVDDIFDYIEHPFQKQKFKHLLVSPQEMRGKLDSLILNEIKNARRNLPAYIYCKINHVSDSEIIHRLYAAANAGVKVKLVVRGMCSLMPLQPKLHGNMEVISIVDRFLEHSRILIFCNNTDEKYFISSADWMTRNFDQRIEAAIPVYSPKIQKELFTIFDYAFRDNVKARVVDGSGENRIQTISQLPFRSQYELYDYYAGQSAGTDRADHD
jgi:polyphosphate kinase